MKIQLALDRMTVEEGSALVEQVRPYVDWVEVGTSLIKEFGMASVRELRRRFPEKKIVADVKTIDNARYEFRLCYEAGADVATVMGVAPDVTLDVCRDVAHEYERAMMIDLLNVPVERVRELAQRYPDAILCAHVSKDQQETGGASAAEVSVGAVPSRWAIAGGITVQSLPSLASAQPEVVIVGGAISKAQDPTEAAREIWEEANRA